MNNRAQLARKKRDDMSPFMVHLTRDDRGEYGGEGGQTALANFTSILEETRIRAYRTHCLHGKQVRQLSDRNHDRFKVACFTETPLAQLRHLLEVLRNIQLEAFGFVFKRDFLLQKGAQPAIYSH